jgi:hypothetical protein
VEVDVTGVSLGRRGRIVGVGAGLAVAVAGVGVGAAYATSGAATAAGAGAGSGSAAVQQVADSTTPPSGGPQGEHRRPPMRDRALRLGGAVEHGELVVKAKEGGTRTVSVQHGSVTEVSAHLLKVKSEDGTTWTYVLDGKTHVRKDGQKAAAGDLKVGDEVRVFADKAGSVRLGRLVLDGHPQRPMRPGAPGAPVGPDQGQAPTAPGATPSGLEGLPGMELLGA